MKVAEIVSVGTELLMGQIADTNAQALGQFLPTLGIACYRRQTVGDNLGRLVETLQQALSRSDFVFTIGGLGPTEDDLTRQGIADTLGVRLVSHPEYAEKLRRLFAQNQRPWTDRQLKQTERPEGAEALENPNGTAPGLWCPAGEKVVIALPGPRGEFLPMLQNEVRPRLLARVGGQMLVSRVLRITGIGEAMVEETLGELFHSENPTLAPYAKVGEVHLRLTALANDEAAAQPALDQMEAAIRTRLGRAVYGRNEEDVAFAVLAALRARGETLGVAESLTGGGLGAALTAIPGASDVFAGGFVTYTPAVKRAILGVETNPVTAETAQTMATAARSKLGVDWALSLTGNAGPTADIDGKPVGRVYVGLAGPNGTETLEASFRGLREDIRARAIQMALTLLWNRLG